MTEKRSNIKDLWNSFMLEGADFRQSKYDIPYCPTTAMAVPKKIITFTEAKEIYKRLYPKNHAFSVNAFVCFYEDDQNFDGKRKGIWSYPANAYNVLKHFEGIITPDFSTYQDFPVSLKVYNTYRMRAFGFWYGNICHKQVINNVRWGTEESYSYCFDGVPSNSIIAIGTVGGSPKKVIDRKRFESGLFEMERKLKPKIILVYGSSKYHCFDELRKKGIKIVQYSSKTASYYEGRKEYEQK